ncbi:MAG: histidine phosphatase family protein [Micropruina sp.]|uniref:histidine phosphatase family protein n=1 Tax=Micropruina sp. TaxID=2737536 RepID=UPI0039E34525
MTAARVVVWRHGETAWNAEGRYQGQADVALNARGLTQAAAAAPRIAALGPDRIVSSDLGRASATAQQLARHTGLPIEFDPRLKEIDVGDWVGMTNAEVFAAHPDFAEALAAGRDARRSASGETGAQAGARVAEALLDIAEASPDGSTVVAVGHGFALRVAMVFLLGLDYAHNLTLGGLWNASWSVLQPGGERWRLLSYNNVADGV